MSGEATAAFSIRGLLWSPGPGFTLDIDALDLPRGRACLLLGPSASGKSTLLSLLGRVEGSYFDPPSPPTARGSILLHRPASPDANEGQVDLLALSERELLSRRIRGWEIGTVFQREGLFAGRSALDNVTWPLTAGGVPPGEARARARTWLDRVGLAEHRAVATLSGGERKRLALARALAPDPPILLLDEPFTGLDPRALAELLDLLAGLAEAPERTVIMVTHQREDIARIGEHVVLLEAGRVVAAGPRADVAEPLDRFLAGAGLYPPAS
jgi:ABC-type proline/glycine betaine transport system ATPase subunit